MKHITILLFIAISMVGVAQKTPLQLTNAVVVGQIDKPEERYALEGALSNLLTQNGVKATASLNFLKLGGDSGVLSTDSLSTILKNQGYDTYIIVNVRGYDRKFKPSERQEPLTEKLGQGSLHELYRQDAVSVTFEFTFYRNGQYISSDLVKLGNISDRETVLKRFNKKVGKRITKKWKK